jgi:peptidoglycan biosynthesis protein MviN/MurJ (putative lipid II flippase)
MSGNQNRLIRVQTAMALFLIAVTLLLVKPFGMTGVALAAAAANAIGNYFYLREVRAALQFSAYNRTYVRLIGPCAVSIGVILGLRFFVLEVHPEWLLIIIALVTSYTTFCGLALLVGLDDDDRMIVGAIQRRLLGIVGRTAPVSS